MELPVDYRALHWKDKRAVRVEYTRLQNGLCYHCKKSLLGDVPSSIKKYRIDWKLFPQGFLDYPVHLHHSHDTGLTLGSVHAYCNAVLWQYFGE